MSCVPAGPACAQIGEPGGDLIKIEHPLSRRRHPPPGAALAAGSDWRSDRGFHTLASANRNKRSILLDPGNASGAEVARRLADRGDVLIENDKAGDPARRKLDDETLAKRSPRLVHCSITAFGQSIGIVLIDAATTLGAHQASNFFHSGKLPQRMNNSSAGIMVPDETLTFTDAHLVVVCGNDTLRREPCAALGRDDLAAHPDYRSASARSTSRVRIPEELRPCFARAGGGRSAGEAGCRRWAERPHQHRSAALRDVAVTASWHPGERSA